MRSVFIHSWGWHMLGHAPTKIGEVVEDQQHHKLIVTGFEFGWIVLKPYNPLA